MNSVFIIDNDWDCFCDNGHSRNETVAKICFLFSRFVLFEDEVFQDKDYQNAHDKTVSNDRSQGNGQ